jgi:hypothetical protein
MWYLGCVLFLGGLECYLYCEVGKIGLVFAVRYWGGLWLLILDVAKYPRI